MGIDPRSAPDLFAEFVVQRERGDAVDFEALVRAYPDREDELRLLKCGLSRVSSLIRKRREGSFFGVREERFGEPAAGVSIGQVVGGYRLVRKIGEGGMGQVWHAEQLSLGRRRVAIKFVRPDLTSPRSLELFQREARAAGRLSHDGIVRVHDYGEDGDLAWIAMEFVEGCWTLRDFLETSAGECLAKDEYDTNVAVFFVHAAKAMAAAHRSGVVHRDLKPGNILINEDDRPKITDFGLARIQGEAAILKVGELAGTRDYMSPEQVAAGRMGLDHRTDIFSLGLALFETLTLRHPFRDEDPQRTVENIITKSPPLPSSLRPGIPPWLDRACLRALEKERDARFQSMTEFADALMPATLTQTTETIRLPGAERARGRDPRAPALLACAALLLYFAVGGWLMLDSGARTHEALAAPRDGAAHAGVESAHPRLAELAAEGSRLSSYFPWWNALPALLAIAITASAFGGLAGCLRSWRRAGRDAGGVAEVLTLPFVGALGGLLVVGFANATAPDVLLETRAGIAALLGTCLAVGYFVSPWIHVGPHSPGARSPRSTRPPA